MLDAIDMYAPRRSQQEWQQLVVQFEASGLSQKAFADANRVNLGTFRHKLYKSRSVRATPRFVEVVAHGSTVRSEPAISVQIGAAQLEFFERPSPDYLVALLLGLKESSS